MKTGLTTQCSSGNSPYTGGEGISSMHNCWYRSGHHLLPQNTLNKIRVFKSLPQVLGGPVYAICAPDRDQTDAIGLVAAVELPCRLPVCAIAPPRSGIIVSFHIGLAFSLGLFGGPSTCCLHRHK
jgi:hypothetical protein